MQPTKTRVSSSSVKKSKEQVVRNLWGLKLRKFEKCFWFLREQLEFLTIFRHLENSLTYPSGMYRPQIFNHGKIVKGSVQTQVNKQKNIAWLLLSFPSKGLEIVLNRS